MRGTRDATSESEFARGRASVGESMGLRPMSEARFRELSASIHDYDGPDLEQVRAKMQSAYEMLDALQERQLHQRLGSAAR